MEALPRRFGFWVGLFAVVASMVGSGILTTSGFVLRATHSHVALFAVWIVAGVAALCGAVTVAEPASAFPRAGGEYVYVREAFGPACAFVFGWATLLAGFAAPIAINASICVDYTLLPLGFPPAAGRVAASVLIAAFTWLHCVGHAQSAWAQGATTVFKIVSLVVFVVLGLWLGKGSFATVAQSVPMSAGSVPELATSVVRVSYSYVGWTGAAYLAGELRDAQRLLPRCLLVGCALVTLLYVATNALYVFAFAPGAFDGLPDDAAKPVAELAARVLFGPQAARVIAIAIGLGVLASLSVFILTGARVTFAMAEDGLFPKLAARVHPTRRTPVVATVVQGGAAIVLLWSGPFLAILDYAAIGLSAMSLLVVGSIFVLRRRPTFAPRYRTPLYPLPPLVFFALAATGVVLVAVAEPLATAASLGSIALGFPLYAALSRRRSTCS